MLAQTVAPIYITWQRTFQRLYCTDDKAFMEHTIITVICRIDKRDDYAFVSQKERSKKEET
jgi:hypothetical protein